MADMRKRILVLLGATSVDVELQDESMDYAIEQALQLWNKYQPYIGTYHVTVPRTEQNSPYKVDFNAPEYSRVRSILDVAFYSDTQVRGSLPALMVNQYNTRMGGYQNRDGRFFFQGLYGLERQALFYGAEPSWHWDSRQRWLLLYNPAQQQSATITASEPLTISQIRQDQATDFCATCLAYAKRIYAQVLGQFGEVPGPFGGIQNNAQDLLSQASEDLQRIEQDLRRSVISAAPPRHIG
jgi:hypothetical protein